MSALYFFRSGLPDIGTQDMPRNMYETIYKNRWQAKKVRMLIWGFAIVAIGALSLASALYPNFGLGMSVFFFAIGTTPLLGMLLFGSIYAAEIRDSVTDIEIDVLTLTGKKTIRVPKVGLRLSKEHRGRIIAPSLISIDTPWIFLYSQGRRLPFFIDLQAEEISREALSRLIPI